MKRILPIVFLAVLLSACSTSTEDLESYKKEVTETELAFAALAKEKGIAVAFESYAAENAVMLRGESLIKGKTALVEFYANYDPESVKLQWTPDFVDVSSSGDLAYTYGKYTFTSIDSLGNEKSSDGFFHTVWKRQESGEWKFVWD